MAMTKRSVIVIAMLIAVWMSMLLWLALPSNNAASKIGSNPLFPLVLTLLALLPLYPLYRLAKAWPQLFWGILALAACLLLTLIVGILHYALHIENALVERMFDLSQVLCLASSLLLVWQAAKKRHT